MQGNLGRSAPSQPPTPRGAHREHVSVHEYQSSGNERTLDWDGTEICSDVCVSILVLHECICLIRTRDSHRTVPSFVWRHSLVQYPGFLDKASYSFLRRRIYCR